jgi:xylose isomerase
MSDFFAEVADPVRPAGRPGSDGLSYRVYDPDRLVGGKRMEDHLRIAVCYWHSFSWPGSDVFGAGTFDRPWLAPSADRMEAAFAKQDAAFEFFAKLGTPFYCFHDVDMAPPATRSRRPRPTWTGSATGADEKMSETGVRADVGHGPKLFSHPACRRCRDEPQPRGVRVRRCTGAATCSDHAPPRW